MTQYILRRLFLLIPVVIGVTFFAHSMLLLTGDPAGALAGEHATPEMREALRERLGLNDPLPIQYARFLGRIFQGDLGRSIMTRIPVATELRLFFPATVELALAAMTIAVLLGVPLGLRIMRGHLRLPSDLGFHVALNRGKWRSGVELRAGAFETEQLFDLVECGGVLDDPAHKRIELHGDDAEPALDPGDREDRPWCFGCSLRTEDLWVELP